MTAEVYKPLRRLTSVNDAWMWYRSYQELYDRATSLVKEDMYMKYYNVRKPLNLEMDTSGVGLGTTLLHVRDDLSCRYDEVPDNAMLWHITFASKNVPSTDQWYSNIGRETLRIQHC